MRPVSKRRAKLLRKVAGPRADYAEQFQICQFPGCPNSGVDIHEMARGCDREVAIQNRCCWLFLCRDDHDMVGEQPDTFPIARQLAWKMWFDPAGYDRQLFNTIRGQQPDAITFAEVDEWVTSDFGSFFDG